ncbi:transcription antitermination factor NusB [Aeromonas diversa]|uniref:Transcription antitermination protein NusB n=1 Tax=Aeromonas diversa CDC 2478-85 TaxID=1268237 RepID=N9U3T7_9GAMM|nr:transcription antitermination factor NusB [Aeromonas diversa]ENY73039.1 transcription antitermination protein NusB [Aeromonas diversa CDC 2478-85]
MKPSERRKARHFATQAIYQWQMTKDNVGDIEEQFKVEQDTKGVDLAYFRDLLFGVSLYCNDLDKVFSPFLSRPLEEVDLVDKAILRLATYELTRRDDVPPRVAINEAIELAKAFAAEDSHKFVNGVLDKVVKSLGKQ